MRELVVFAIGPVQSYIAAARRTLDLWAGSRILSEIMRAALQAVPEESLIIYPRPRPDGEWPDSLPNRAILLAEDGKGAALAELVTEAAQGHWQKVAKATRREFEAVMPIKDEGRDWREIWERQTAGWLEVYWVVYPWDEQKEAYGSAYRQANLNMDARKQLRHYPVREEYDVKSSLDGIHQALRGPAKEWDAGNFWNDAQRQAGRGQIRSGERLSAIDVVKRFAQDAGSISRPELRIPSTSSIAAADFRASLAEKQAALVSELKEWADALDALVETFSNREQQRLRFSKNAKDPIPKLQRQWAENDVLQRLSRYDGDYYYPHFYTEARFVEMLGRERRSRLTKGQNEAIVKAGKALRKLYKACQKEGVAPPSTYYAVLAMDADHMGRRLSESGMTVEKHRAISLALADFAQNEVSRIVGEEHPGLLVYAGGDDVLALLPVSHVLSVAEELRRAFSTRLEPDLVVGATMSAGVAIVHQQNPLQQGIKAAQKAEREAKDDYGRAAIVVHRFTRSGAPQLTGNKWSVSTDQDFIPVVIAMQQLIAQGKLSGKFAFELLEEAPALSMITAAYEAEIGRLLKRHCTAREYEPDVVAQQPVLTEIAQALVPVGERSGLELLADWLLVARFLAQGGDE